MPAHSLWSHRGFPEPRRWSLLLSTRGRLGTRGIVAIRRSDCLISGAQSANYFRLAASLLPTIQDLLRFALTRAGFSITAHYVVNGPDGAGPIGESFFL